MRQSRPRGFTMIEMLWVVFVISVLISLLLPAVQSAREEARRMQCVNNLLQISLATRAYETTYRVYPPGVVDTTGPIYHTPVGYHVSWAVQILPYLDRKAILLHLDPNKSVYDPTQFTTTRLSIHGFLCPSDGFAPPPQNGLAYAAMSYAACHSGTDEFIDKDNNGVFFLNSAIKDDDIPDGLATTIFFGEKRNVGGLLGWASGTRSTLRNMEFPVNRSPELNVPRAMLYSDPFEDDPGKEQDPDDLDPDAPPRPKPQPKPNVAVLPGKSGGFSSHHRSGANFAFGDGSVRFIKDSIDLQIYRQLGQRNDLNLISAGSF